jgi:chemotaxis family two-component system response regulator Rcp1
MIEILLVEDNPADVRLAQETLKEHRMQNTLHLVGDGEEALQFLRREGKHQNVVTPDLVLLDINLPKVDGLEVLAEVYKDPRLATIPIVVLTSSRLHQEMIAQHNLPVECYITKPLTIDRYLDAIKCFPHLGMSIVTGTSAT